MSRGNGSALIDIRAVAEQLLARADTLVPQWLPAGKLHGREWVCGSLHGEAGESCSINLSTGAWSDFATGDAGGDLVALYAAIQGCTQLAAARAFAYSPQDRIQPVSSKPLSNGHAKIKPWTADRPLEIPPQDAPPPDLSHVEHGAPSSIWPYHLPDGRIVAYVARYETPGGKQILPWRFYSGAWRAKSTNKPRLLYGLNRLAAAAPDAHVLICEGEKATDAAGQLLGGYVCMTWPGGASAVRHADWSVLARRSVDLWPDADPPGVKAMHELAKILLTLKCTVRIIEPEGRAPGFDAADALQIPWTVDMTLTWLRGRIHPYPKPPKSPQAASAPADPPLLHRGTPPESSVIAADPSRYVIWQTLGLDGADRGKPVANVANFAAVIAKHPDIEGKVWHDRFLGRVMTQPAVGAPHQWSDDDDIAMTVWIQSKLGISSAAISTVHEAVAYVAQRHPRHCVQDWLGRLTWDHTDRLEHLLPDGFGTAQTPYTAAVGRCFMLGMIARAMNPGCKVDTLPVFEGSQGIGKSQALALLGGPWFAECHESISSKDFFQILQGKLLVEISELHSFRRADIDRIKGILSCRIDRYREPYGRNASDHPRQTVFAGSTNRDDWQADDTGARRFWPVRCGEVNLDWIGECREQLFAEALHRYRSGETWWNVPEGDARAEQDERHIDDPWLALIAQYLDTRLRSSRLTVAEIMDVCLSIPAERQTKAYEMRVTAVLKQLGWIRKQSMEKGQKIRWWSSTDMQ